MANIYGFDDSVSEDGTLIRKKFVDDTGSYSEQITSVQMVADGANVSFGAKSDAVATNDTGTFSFIALFKRLLQKFVVDSTDRIRVSLYGKVSAAGDNPIELITGSGTPINAIATINVVTNGSVFTSARSAGSVADGNNGGSYPANGQYWYNGATWDRIRIVNTLKTAQSTGLVSSSDLDIWTPAASKRFRLRNVKARASIAGRYEIRDQSTVITFCYLSANTWTELINLESNGYLSLAVNNVLRIRNASGSTSDIDIIASGNEE